MVFWFLGKTNDSHNLKEKQLAKESWTKDPDDNKLKGFQKKEEKKIVSYGFLLWISVTKQNIQIQELNL